MKNYCRCDTPDKNGKRSECGREGVQCQHCAQKDIIDNQAENLKFAVNCNKRLRVDFDDQLAINGEQAEQIKLLKTPC
ncbi:hypothetical protein NVP1076O_19 [Vibrio phage 1.076.O._10N.286.51.B7]|nr:hypothetical protein NVP1076O_19 [Vibrio phage 1.076.O._10N.286.51.B7]